MKRSLLLALAVLASFTILKAQQPDTTRIKITSIEQDAGSAKLPSSLRAVKTPDGFVFIDNSGDTLRHESNAAQGDSGKDRMILRGSVKELSEDTSGKIQVAINPDGTIKLTQQGGPVEVGGMVPDFEVELVGGSRVRMSDLRGKVVLLNFWATWCGPCVSELRDVQKEVLDRFAGDDFVFLPISRGEEKAKVLEFRKTNNYTFPMGLDPETKVFPLFAEQGIPRSYVINRDGTIASIELGYNPTNGFTSIIADIEEALAK